MSSGGDPLMPTLNYSYLSAGSSNKASIDERDWKHQYDVLHRELQRKDHRNDSLTKELQQLRKVCADQQRELRLTGNLSERVKEDNQQLNKELVVVKDKNYTLLGKLKVLSNSQALVSKIHSLEAEREELQGKITSLNGELSLRQERYKALEEELVIAHRSIQVQSKYEKLLSFHPNAINNRDAMRALYYDMGKKQSQLHSVTLSLAEATKELQSSKQEVLKLTASSEGLERENNKLRSNTNQLSLQSVGHTDLIAALKQDVIRLDAAVEKLLQENASLRDQLRRDNAASSEELHLRGDELTHLSDLLARRELECKQLQQRIEDFQQALSVVENLQMISEQKSADEISHLRAEIKGLIENSVQHSVTVNQLELTRKTATELGHSKQALDSEVQVLRSSLAAAEKQVAAAERSINALDDKCQSLSADLGQMREQFKVVALERSEAADALRQTMRAARDLSMKYSQERDLRVAADKMVEQLQQHSKTSIISDATLEALQQEKRKSAALQQSLSLVPLILKWRLAAHPDRGSILSSLNELKKSSAGSSSGIHQDSSSSSSSTNSDLSQPQDITEHLLHTAGEDAAYIEQSISNIARLLESPLGLKDGVDAAFEWLLQRPGEEETHAEKGSMEASHPHTTQINEDEYAFSLMDIASSTALGAGTAGKEIIDSPGTVRIISALRGRGRVSSDLLSAGLDPTEEDEEEEEEEALSDREPVSGAEETRSQRSVAFRPMLEERNPMLEELQRLRDELNVLDTSSPSSGNMSSRPHDRSSTSVEEEGASSASYLGTTVSDSYDTDIS